MRSRPRLTARSQLAFFEPPPRAKKLARADRLAQVAAQALAMREASRCPMCGCHAAGPRCTVVLPHGAGVGACVPRGRHGLPCCSACELRTCPP